MKEFRGMAVKRIQKFVTRKISMIIEDEFYGDSIWNLHYTFVV